MIYFVRAGRRRLVKIGYSKEHPAARIKTLQTGSPEPLELIGLLEGSPKDEAAWHRRFRHLRITGEWFRWTGDLPIAARPHLLSTAQRRYDRSLREWKALADKLPAVREAVRRIEARLSYEEIEQLNRGE